MAADPTVTPLSDAITRSGRMRRRHPIFVVSLALVAWLVGGCTTGEGGDEAGEEEPAASILPSPSPSTPTLEDGPVPPGRYVVMPPAVGWAECPDWVPECPPEPPLARSLRVEITIPRGWAADADGTIIVPAHGSTEAPEGAGLVMGWTTPTSGLHADPCQAVSHLPPDISVGPSVDAFVEAVVAHPSLKISKPVDVELGGYRGAFFQLTAPSDISDCHDWRPFEPGIFAQGPDNLWSVWVLDVDGLRMIVLTEVFPDTPAKDQAALHSMVESIRFLS